MTRHSNPQGKGMVPVLDSLAACRPRNDVPPKRIDQVTRELFTSLFVLESEFKFKPVLGRPYWLYRKDQRFRLSPVAPDEWGSGGLFGQYVGECVLHDDLTWSLGLSDAAAGDPLVQALIAQRRRTLEQALQDADAVENALPVFEASLPFYQRLFASGLSHSLRISMRRSGIEGLSYAQAYLALPGTVNSGSGSV